MGVHEHHRFFRGVFGDFRTIWWDAADPNRIMLGSDGGVSVSYDGGRTAMTFLNKALGEVYAIGVDMDDPYNVYAGLQDHDSWKGPSNGRPAGSRSITGRRSDRATACTTRSIRPTRAGSTTRARWATTGDSIRRPASAR